MDDLGAAPIEAPLGYCIIFNIQIRSAFQHCNYLLRGAYN